MAGKHTEDVENKKEKKKSKTILKVIGIILLVLILLAVSIVGVGYWYINNKLAKMQQVEIKEEELTIDEQVEEQLSGYRNIAIFGVDSRSSNLGKGNRSDCIIIASINNATKEVKLASVYRDTYVQIEKYGLDKITHAYSYGEAPLALSTLNTNLDLNIKEFVTVNFEAVAEAIDLLGGIEIDVEANEINYINSYQKETARVTGKQIVTVTKTGPQTLNGVQAVAYGRIRYTEGGDYKRTERMRDVIIAMLKKLQTKNALEINNLLDQILSKVYTNIEPSSIISEIPKIPKYKVTESIGWPYETKGITIDRWYGVPITLESNVQKLHQELFEEPDYVVSDTVKNISDKIVKRTGYR